MPNHFLRRDAVAARKDAKGQVVFLAKLAGRERHSEKEDFLRQQILVAQDADESELAGVFGAEHRGGDHAFPEGLDEGTLGEVQSSVAVDDQIANLHPQFLHGTGSATGRFLRPNQYIVNESAAAGNSESTTSSRKDAHHRVTESTEHRGAAWSDRRKERRIKGKNRLPHSPSFQRKHNPLHRSAVPVPSPLFILGRSYAARRCSVLAVTLW